MTEILERRRGSRPVSLEQMKGLPTPPATKSFTPISHYDFVSLILELGQKILIPQGFKEREVRADISRDNMKLFGVASYGREGIDMRDGIIGGTNFAIGYRQALDRSMACGFALGADVDVCDNMVISGDEVIFRKHTGDVVSVLKDKISLSLLDAPQVWDSTVADTEKMINTPMGDDPAFELFGKAYGSGLLRLHQFGEAVDQWMEPARDYGTEKTMWNWYNAITWTFKKIPIRERMSKHRKLHSFAMQSMG